MRNRSRLLAGATLLLAAVNLVPGPSLAADAVRTFRFGSAAAPTPAFAAADGEVIAHLDGASATVPVVAASDWPFANLPAAVSLRLVAGTLPPGAALRDGSVSVPSFAPTGATYAFTLEATNAAGVSARRSFAMTSRLPDTTPDAFALSAAGASASSAEPGSKVSSVPVRLTGFDAADASVAGGEYRICAAADCSDEPAWTASPATGVRPGGYAQVRAAAPAWGATATATLTVGTTSASFRVTGRAQDTLPDAFVVAGVTKAEPSTVATSAAVTPTGFEGSVTITVSGGTASVAGGAYAASGTIALGQSFTVRATSSAGFGADATATVTVGTGAAVPFTVRTRADVVLAAANLTGTVGTPLSFDFKALTTTQGVATSALSYASADKPSWMTLDAGGAAGGTPGAEGAASFEVVASHADGSGRRTYSIVVGGRSLQVSSLVSGSNHSCAVTPAGGVVCWGYNGSGQVGDGTTTDRTVPTQVVGLTSGVASLAAGGAFTCALTTAGAVRCWGFNNTGQIGDGTATTRPAPTQVSGLTSGVASVYAGSGNACALTTGGALKCWGSNSDGQVGDGTKSNKYVPTQVSGLTSGVASAAIGLGYACALTTSGGVRCWGSNYFYGLGDGTDTSRTSPGVVSGLSSGVAAISIGAGNHACALTTGGAMKCWGYNASGQLGDGTTTNRSTPVSVSGLSSGVASIGVSYWHTCAVTASGAAKCWGTNSNGQLGDGSTANKTAPTQVTGLSSGVLSVTGGFNHVCAVTQGGAKCWGQNSYGQVGDGTTTLRTTPTAVTTF